MIEENVRKTIIEKHRNAEWAINDISLELMNSLSTIKDDYLRERIIDMSDINKRLISNLQKTEPSSLQDINEEVIVFAPDLTPSETALMNKEHILAFVTDRGGRTSHTAIMARALEIPAIVGTMNITSMVKNGDMVIVDAVHGRIIIDPTPAEIEEYRQYAEEFKELEMELAKLTNLPAKTLDGEEIFIYGNIEIPDEMKIIKDHGAQGIGLFRSEFLFMDQSLPDEEKQFQEYRRVVEFFKPMPVTIRTIDVGADKVYAYTNHYKERNPFLGCRAIRFSLENLDLFRIQLRAILRASAYGNVKLMFPMITTIEELHAGAEDHRGDHGRAQREGSSLRRKDQDRAHDRGPLGGGLCRHPRRSTPTSFPWGPTTWSSTSWRWTGSAKRSRISTTRSTSRCSAFSSRSSTSAAATSTPALDLRRDGRRAAVHHAAPGPRFPAPLHEPGLHVPGQKDRPVGIHRGMRGAGPLAPRAGKHRGYRENRAQEI